MKILYTSLIMMLVGCGVEEHKGIIATRDNYTQPIETQVPDDTGLQESVVTQAPVVAQQPESASTVSTSSSTTAVTSTSSTTVASTVQAILVVVQVQTTWSLAELAINFNDTGILVPTIQWSSPLNAQFKCKMITVNTDNLCKFLDGYIFINSTTSRSAFSNAAIQVYYGYLPQ